MPTHGISAISGRSENHQSVMHLLSTCVTVYTLKNGFVESTYISSHRSQSSSVIYLIMRMMESRRGGGRPNVKGAAALPLALFVRTVTPRVYKNCKYLYSYEALGNRTLLVRILFICTVSTTEVTE
jgi:hypothetical protein